MNYYKLTISYKGTNYWGWQIQPEPHKISIEGTILKALKKIDNSDTCKLSGASRTDAGVHALGQIAKVSTQTIIDPNKLRMGLNSSLPTDIKILECTTSNKSFNPIKDCKSKTYNYNFSVGNIENPITADFTKNIRTKLNINLMNDAAKKFVGENDFYNFSSRSGGAKTTIRKILNCEIVEKEPDFPNQKKYTLTITGVGFLKQMVRYIVGALFKIGTEEIEITKIEEYLKKHKEDKISAKASAKGLCLICIE